MRNQPFSPLNKQIAIRSDHARGAFALTKEFPSCFCQSSKKYRFQHPSQPRTKSGVRDHARGFPALPHQADEVVRDGARDGLRVHSASVRVEAGRGLHRARDGAAGKDLRLHVQRAVHEAVLADLVVSVVGDGRAGAVGVAGVALVHGVAGLDLRLVVVASLVRNALSIDHMIRHNSAFFFSLHI
jgi:hypothetical protein